MNKKIIVMSMAIFSMIILMTSNNIDKAYAITLRSNEPDTSMETPSGFGYNVAHDYLLTAELQGGFCHVHIIDGEDLSLVADITTSMTVCNVSGINSIPCSASVCIVTGSITNNPSIVRISMSTLAVVATYTESEYALCSLGSVEISGTNIYALISDFGNCPYSGIYSLSIGFTADVGGSNIQWVEYDDTTSFGDLTGDSCLVEGNFIHIDKNNQRVRKYALGSHTLTSSNALGALITQADCDTNLSTGYVYVTSINGDWVKRVRLSDLSIDGTSFSITNPQYVFQRGDSVYVSRDDASTVTAISKNNWADAFTLFSSLAHNDVAFFKGNSTRFNMVAPTTNDNIFYAVDGVLDSDEEDTPSGTTEFCNDPANVDKLICALGGNGTLGSAGAFVIGNTTEGTGILGLGCNMGIVDCSADSNPQTNGLGYLIFIGAIFVVVGMYYRSLGAEATFKIPLFMWVLILLSLSAFFTITGLIDPTFLILSVIAIIALGVPKIVNRIHPSGMGSGSSE